MENKSMNIIVPEKQLRSFCHRHHIKKLSFFGSVIHDTFNPESDIDILVEFETGYTPGLRLIRMQDELSQMFEGRKIDLVTPKFLNKRIREKVLAEALIQYART